MAVISRIVTWSDNQVLTAAALNGEFNNLLNDYNGNISNANLAPNAGVAESKVAFSNTGHGHTGGSDGKVISIPASTPPSGWITNSNTWTYVSTDGHTYVVTVNADLTASIGVGDRISLSQASAQYFIVTAISVSSGVTTLTLYGGTNYAVTAGAISSTMYSHAKTPFGFPANPSLWTEELGDSTRRTASSPVANTWYNIGSQSLTIPVGLWNVNYHLTIGGLVSGQFIDQYITLSTSNSSESDNDFTSLVDVEGANSTNTRAIATVTKSKILSLSSKTQYFLNTKTTISSVTQLDVFNHLAKGFVRAVCAYL